MISFCLAFLMGLVAIDLHFDHWSLAESAPDATRVGYAVGYYRNMETQPVWMQVVIPGLIAIGGLSLVLRLKNYSVVYDVLMLPLFVVMVYLFVGVIVPARQAILRSDDDAVHRGMLKTVAVSHATIIVCAFIGLLIQGPTNAAVRAINAKTAADGGKKKH